MSNTKLTQTKILWFWLPLAASWMLMTLEGPSIQAAIARLPEVKTMLAAAGIVIALEVTIESPVIMLLATSTALATSSQAYKILSRFVLYLNIILTVIAAAIAFINPIYNGLVPGLMGIPSHIAEAAQPAMQIMTLWSAIIGWRRFYQGILIRFGKTRLVGLGTLVRLITVIIVAFSLVVFSKLPGVIVGAYTWMAGVTSELIYAYLVSRETINTHLSGPSDPTQTDLTYWDIIKYHTPLAATTLLSLLAQPLIGAALARMAFPEENLAAWPVVVGLFLFFRSFAFALPEIIIALLNVPDRLALLRRFSLQVGVGSSLAMAIVTFTPLLTLYLFYITGITTDLIKFILPGAIVGLFLPLLSALQSWYRGVLMVAKVTGHIYVGMGINLAVTVLVLIPGVIWQTDGVATASAALSIGIIAETIYLWWRVKPVQAGLVTNIKPIPV